VAVQNSSYAVGVRNAVFIALSECIKGDFGAVTGSKFALVLRGQCTSQIGDGIRHVCTMGPVDAPECIEDSGWSPITIPKPNTPLSSSRVSVTKTSPPLKTVSATLSWMRSWTMATFGPLSTNTVGSDIIDSACAANAHTVVLGLRLNIPVTESRMPTSFCPLTCVCAGITDHVHQR